MTISNQSTGCAKCREIAESIGSGDSEALTYRPSSIYAESELVILVDVKRAYELVEARRQMPTFANDTDDLVRLVSDNEICEEHIYHVDSSKPGLLVTFDFYNLETQSRENLNVLADGNHRAVRSLLERRRFDFYYFDAEATKMIIEAWR